MPETRRLESFAAGYGRGLEQPAGYDVDHRRGLSMTADSWQRAPGRTAARRRGGEQGTNAVMEESNAEMNQLGTQKSGIGYFYF